MLSKQYLKYRRSGDYLKIVFKRTDDIAALETSDMLLELFRTAEKESWRRRMLEEAVQNAGSGSTDIKFAQALASLLFKRVNWRGGGSSHGEDFAIVRSKLFALSGELLRSGRYQELVDFQNALPVPDGMDIYGDLPENDIVDKFKDISGRGVLELYNMAQVQGLLMRARELEITFRNPDTVKLRNIFKYLKFCRLLAEIKRDKGVVTLKVSGPLALLSDNRKYGLQLAVFFPAVATMSEWRLKCDIELENGLHPYRLILDEQSGLVSHYRHYSNYLPEEIKLFQRHFAENSPEYTIEYGGEALKLKGGGIIVPDFTFRRVSDGEEYYLELFHRFHANALMERISGFNSGSIPYVERLLIGVDRSLTGSGTVVDEFVAGNPDRVFLFRDFPGVATVLKLLRRRN